MIKISTELNTHRLQGVLDFLAKGTPVAYILLYSGERPLFAQEPTGDLLVELPLAEPLGQIVDGVLQLTASDEAMVLVTGIATWARVFNGEHTIGWDCDVSDSAGTGDIRLMSTTLYAGGFARVVSGTLR